jgi:hypothetical protein
MIRLSFTILILSIALSTQVFAQSLVHYWNFNQIGSESQQLTPTSSIISGASLIHTPGASSVIQLTSNTGQGFTTGMNERNGDSPDAHLRLNNPAGATLTLSVPTTGYQNILVKYAVRRSSTSAAEQQQIEYSVDGSNYTVLTSYTISETGPEVKTLDFSSISTVNNNPNFKIKINCIQGTGGTTGNHRIDNLTVDGNTMSSDITPPTVAFSPVSGSSAVFTSVMPTITFNEDVRLLNNTAIDNNNVDNVVELRLNSTTGTLVPFDATFSNNVITVTPTTTLSNSQVYVLVVKGNTVEDLSENAIVADQSSSFTTIVPQTSFQAGDLVFVAYRMSSLSTDDGFAILSLVDILPGTMINFTDAKYTDNAVPQCAGGITWTAPAQGINSGTVMEFNLVTPSVSVGSISGSGFGLSSGGDQIVVYAGPNTNPTFITALSSNAWVTGAHTVCSGSLSKIPAGLSDGVTSIQFSTKTTLGNTANGFYSGTMAGSISSLKSSILDTTNWTVSVLNSAPQTWPVWAFPGPPVVISAKVISQTSIRVIFNRDMENASATNTNNYTGISGLLNVTRSNNGSLSDTVILNFSNNFVNGNPYILTIDQILDSENRSMADPYVYSFVYESVISLDKKSGVAFEGGSIILKLKIENPSNCSVNLVLKSFGTAIISDHNFSTTTITLTESDSEKEITLPIPQDTEEEMDEYFTISVEANSGCSISGSPYFTAYIKDDDREVPVATEDVDLSFVSRFTVANPTNAAGLAEIVSYDAASKRLFTISTGLERFDIVNFSDPENPSLVSEISTAAYGAGITSIAVKNGIVAVSVTGPNNEQENGSVLFYDVDGNFLKQLTVGALPDMITFTPDASKVLTANEGQPSLDYTIDPEGSISIIDISGGIGSLTQTQVTTLDFTSFNANEASLIASGVRKGKSSSTLSQDFEPEYITISADSKTAWISLQENNAIAALNLETNTYSSVYALGTKDYSQFGNGLDVSDKTSAPIIANWPVKGFYMPDAIANFEIGSNTYLISANEGDEREYTSLNERSAVSSITLDPTQFPDGNILKQEVNLGRYRITNLHGDADQDLDFDELYSVGSRSFSIWNAANMQQVFDSGDDFERITEADVLTSSIFNTDNANNNFKERSRAKGPEPEGVTIAKIGNEVFAFITLERIGGVMTYNVSDPENAYFVDYVNSRSNTQFAGDNGPEGILYINGNESPDGKFYIITANEVSGTLAIYEIEKADLITSNQETETQRPLKLYPNPSAGKIHFTQPVSGTIQNAFGQSVLTLDNSISAEISAPSGIYTFVSTDGIAIKFIIR